MPTPKGSNGFDPRDTTMIPLAPKTAKDCAACPKVSICSAHITGGTHNPRDSGCRPVITAEKMDAASRKFCTSIDEMNKRNPIINSDTMNREIFEKQNKAVGSS